MAFCLLARDRLSGTFSLLSPVSFSDVDEAVAVLTGLVSAGDVDAGAVEPMVVDVSGAARLLVVSLPTEPAEEVPDAASEPVPAAGAWEAPPEAQPEPLWASAGEPIGKVAPVVTTGPEPGQESEPVPVPFIESLGSVPEPAAEFPPLSAFQVPVEPPLVPAGHGVEPITRLEPVPTPWERVTETAVTDAQAPEESDLAAEEAATESADAEEPQAAVEVPSHRVEEAAPEGPEPKPQADEHLPAGPSLEALPVIVMDAGPYEVSGELVLERYTCSDCVYANTCPKVGQSTPADCGSFQWNVT